jgi:hypothetical protein
MVGILVGDVSLLEVVGLPSAVCFAPGFDLIL